MWWMTRRAPVAYLCGMQGKFVGYFGYFGAWHGVVLGIYGVFIRYCGVFVGYGWGNRGPRVIKRCLWGIFGVLMGCPEGICGVFIWSYLGTPLRFVCAPNLERGERLLAVPPDGSQVSGASTRPLLSST
jgi:hypothetical protein